MIDTLIQGFDDEIFCSFLNSRFSGSFSASRSSIPIKEEFAWESAERLGVIKTLAGPHQANRPLLVVTAKLSEGEMLKERSSRIKQFKFAKQILDDAMSNPAPGVEGVLSQGLFVFYDDHGNFRLSLVFGKAEGTKLVWSTAKRQSFYVEAGTGNKTFRDRTALDWSSFDKLKEAFSVEKLTKEFYGKLFAWYQWALSDEMDVTYPNKMDTDDDNREINEHIIRLITRLMFVWFLKQKHLVPDDLFEPAALKALLKNFDPLKGDNYYRAILQNLFFATLNSEIPERAFAVDAGNIRENREHFDIKTLYRYGAEFSIPQDEVLKLFEKIPFLNGGLFECLDRGTDYSDGFSRNKKRQANLPNRLFFDTEKGLIPLLNQYHFTVEENSPGDEDVALDPELLGKVFENLLGAYNPETEVVARKTTGSFYTPREIVNYMVDESLKAHVSHKVAQTFLSVDEQAEMPVLPSSCEDDIQKLFAIGERPSDEHLCKVIDEALVSAKILDPACGSGAFPMGILLRMVELLRILRNLPEDDSVYDLKLELIQNCIYGSDIQSIAVQIAKLRFFISLVCEQKPSTNVSDNYGIHSLPNLETKFVAADSLIGLPSVGKDVLGLGTGDIADLKEKLWDVRQRHFSAKNYQQKKKLRNKDEDLRNKIKAAVKQDAKPDQEKLSFYLKQREEIAEPKWVVRESQATVLEMFSEYGSSSEPDQNLIDTHAEERKNLDAAIAIEQKKTSLPTTEVDLIADMLADWDPYEPNKSATFFDPEWMFNVKDGFDIVIGNPPYGISFSGEISKLLKKTYRTYALRGESYVLFVERATSLLGETGLLAFIIPDTYLNLGFTQPLRDFLLKETTIKQIYALPAKVFTAAVVDTTLLFSQKAKHTAKSLGYNIQVKHLSKDALEINLTYPTVDFMIAAQTWKEQGIFNINCSSAEVSILRRIDSQYSPLSTYANVLSGIKAYEVGQGKPPQTPEIRRTKPYTGDVKKTGWSPFYEGKHIVRFGTQWKNDNWINYGPWLAAPRDFDRFQGKKVLVRKIVDRRLIGTFMSKECYCNTLLFIIKTKDQRAIDEKNLLAILCSEFIGWYFKKRFQISNSDTFPQILARDILKFSIPVPDNDHASRVRELIDSILTVKKADPTADTSALEAEIDQLVYQLYGLTEEEIAIVEASVAPKAETSKPATKATSSAARAGTESPKKKAPKKRKAQLPPSLPGWD